MTRNRLPSAETSQSAAMPGAWNNVVGEPTSKDGANAHRNRGYRAFRRDEEEFLAIGSPSGRRAAGLRHDHALPRALAVVAWTRVQTGGPALPDDRIRWTRRPPIARLARTGPAPGRRRGGSEGMACARQSEARPTRPSGRPGSRARIQQEPPIARDAGGNLVLRAFEQQARSLFAIDGLLEERANRPAAVKYDAPAIVGPHRPTPRAWHRT